MKRVVFRTVVVALFLVLIVVVGGCAKPQETGGELKILSHRLTTHGFAGGMPQSTATVTGRAQNVGAVTINYARIAVNYYDKDGRFLATASAIMQNLAPGQVWDFTVLFQGPDAWKAVKYDIAASTK
ncbi:MAG: hypothetical protein FJ024_08960 [Chloroflexi bacterium]|nr:hypothetical protein [Chloroflexota bacterium]